MRKLANVFCLGLGLVAMGSAKTFYVATSGSDANAGSAARPWRTVQHACDAAASGDTVLVHSGRYVGRVIISKPLTLKAVAGETPVLDGTGVAVPESGSGLVLIENVDRVTLSGFIVRNFQTTNSKLCPIGIFIQGKCDGATLQNNKVYNIANNGTSADSINALGIAVYGNSRGGPITNLIIDGNEVSNTKTGSSETITVNGNVDGFRVTGNRVHDVNNIGIDCIGWEGVSPIRASDYARNGYVGRNTVTNVTSRTNPAYHGERSADGLYVDGGADIILDSNIVRTCDIGIEVTSEHGGKVASGVVVRNNLVWRSNTVGLSIGGYARSKGGTQSCTFVNNTFYQNDTTKTGSGEFQIQYNTSSNVFANNILVASSQGVLISSLTGVGSAVGVTSDHNLYDAPANPAWRWNGKTYSSFAAFAQGSGNEAHSIFASPAFTNPASGDFRLKAGSPALDLGKNHGSDTLGLTDLAGNSRVQGSGVDLGCYERPVAGG